MSLYNSVQTLQKTTIDNSVKETCKNFSTSLLYISEMNLNKYAKKISEKKLIENFIEALSESEDLVVKKFRKSLMNNLYINHLGLSEMLCAIEADYELCENINMQYTLQNCKRLVDNYPEYTIAESFVNELTQYSWSSTIKEGLEKINKTLEDRKIELNLHKSIYFLQMSESAYIVDSIRPSLNAYLESRTNENKSVLISSLSNFAYDKHVAPVIESIIGSDATEIQSSKDCTISKIYSPVILNENKDAIFTSKGKFYLYLNESKAVRDLTQKEIAYLDRDFLQLCEFLNQDFVIVEESFVKIYKGADLITVNETLKYNGEEINELELYTTMFNNSIFDTSVNYIKQGIALVKEHFSKIKEIDFAKRITSNVTNRYVDVFINETVSVYTSRDNIKESVFFSSISPVSAVGLIKSHIGYDISNLINADNLATANEKINKIKESKKTIIENINFLESRIAKIKSSPKEINDHPQVQALLLQLEKQVNEEKQKYNEIDAEYKMSMNESVSTPDYNLSKTQYKVKMGDNIITEGNKARGMVIGLNGQRNECDVCLMNGNIVKMNISKVVPIESAVQEAFAYSTVKFKGNDLRGRLIGCNMDNTCTVLAMDGKTYNCNVEELEFLDVSYEIEIPDNVSKPNSSVSIIG